MYTVNHLSDPATKMWNMDLINAIIYLDDIPLIRSICISSASYPDSPRWHFTKSGKNMSDQDIIKSMKSH